VVEFFVFEAVGLVGDSGA